MSNAAAALPQSNEATGSQAGNGKKIIGDEAQEQVADYMGLVKKSAKELNHRRTQLQLGLPGSPQDEVAESAGDTTKNASWHASKSSSSSSGHKPPPSPQDCVEKHVVEDPAAPNQARAPVGWPPVQSFRKNSLTGGSKDGTTVVTNGTTMASHHNNHQQTSLFVKVYMDGVPIGRKVNLRTHGSYDKLSTALEEMFRRFISGQAAAANGSTKGTSTKDYKLLLTECKKFNFIYGSDYVLTYEDKDGDLMLVGDVPWELFVGNVKRLRIMKGSEAIGLAPRNGDANDLAAATTPGVGAK